MSAEVGTAVVDRLRRSLRDVRISLTDRCNFRCRYCMPREVFGPGHQFMPTPSLLTIDEIERLARVFVGLGVDKIRLTGGEPLLRRGLEELVRRLARLAGVDDLALTTNGYLLTPERARALRASGLGRVTVSLDALDDPTFMAMNDARVPVSRILDAIEAAAAAGLAPASSRCWQAASGHCARGRHARPRCRGPSGAALRSARSRQPPIADISTLGSWAGRLVRAVRSSE